MQEHESCKHDVEKEGEDHINGDEQGSNGKLLLPFDLYLDPSLLID